MTDNGDPKCQGRVRVMYPWQTSSELVELKKQATITNENKTAAENKEKAAKRKLEEQEKKWKTDSQRLIEVQEFLKLTASERSQKIPAQSTINTLSGEITSLEAKVSTATNDEKNAKGPIKKRNAKRKLEKLREELRKKQDEKDHLTQQKTDFEKAHNDKVTDPQANPPVDKDQYDDNTNPVVVELMASLEETQIQIAEARKAHLEAEGELNKQKKEDDEINKKIATVYKTLSSPWIRVATPMATSGGGTYFKPQKGDEVLVDYDNGNIERPYVVGSLFSKNVLEPQEYLGRKNTQGGGNATMAIVSPNGHHITFSDPSGNMDFFSKGIFPGMGMYASLFGTKIKDLNDLKDLGGGIHIGDRYGIYEIDMKSQSRNISIKSPFGTIDLNAFNGITINAPNGDVRIKGKNISLEAGNKISVTSGTNIPNHSDDSIGILMGKTAIKTVASDLTKTYVTSLVDLTLVRSVIETFARPIDGTLLIKSKKYLKLEAGKGKAIVNTNRYHKTLQNDTQRNEEFCRIIQEYIRLIDSNTDYFFQFHNNWWNLIQVKKEAYDIIAEDILEDKNNPNLASIAYKERDNDDVTKLKASDFNDCFKEGINPSEGFNQIKDTANEYKRNVYNLYQFTNLKKFFKCFNINSILVPDDFKFITIAFKSLFEPSFSSAWLSSQFTIWDNTFGNGENCLFNISMRNDEPFSMLNKTNFKRILILQFLYSVFQEQEKENKNRVYKLNYLNISYNPDTIINPDNIDLNTDHNWAKLIDSIKNGNSKSKWLVANEFTGKKVEGLINNAKDLFESLRDKEVWNNDLDGQILFSDIENGTHQFENSGIKFELHNELQQLKDYIKNIK